MNRLAPVLILLACAAPDRAQAQAQAQVPVRVGDHPGFGRIVFDFTTSTRFDMAEQGDRVLVVFTGSPPIAAPDAIPRNVVSVSSSNGATTVVLAHGARLRPLKMGNRVVLDVLDPVAPKARPAIPARAPALPAPAATRESAPAPVPPPEATPAASPQTAARPELVPDTPAAIAPAETALHIPAEPGIGAAAFRRGDTGVVVFDRRLALEPQRLADRTMAAVIVPSGGDTTVLTMRLDDGQALAVARDAEGWTVTLGATPERHAVDQAQSPDGIALKLDRPGRALTITDPLTGQALLIGTTLSGDGQAMVVGRSAPGYALLPTWLGIAVEPSSDRVDLRAAAAGYILAAPEPGPAVAAVAPGESRRFDIPNDALPDLTRRLQAQLAGAAAAASRSRGPGRVAAAQTMLALGMAPEAQALLRLAASDDPAVAADATATGLAAAAAVLAGRPAEAEDLDDVRLAGTDEIELWRGVRDAALGKPADGLGRHLGLLASYPEALQRTLFPVVAEALVQAGRPLPPHGAPAFAMALQQEKRGETDAALAAYDSIAAGRDRRDSVRASIRGTELRLSTGRITATAAADALERQTFAWRGDAIEGMTRLRVAELRTTAGEWRTALDWLRQTEALFPQLKPEGRARKAEVFRALLASAATAVKPLDLVSLAGDYADCVPDGHAGEALSAMLADKLVALDLPSRAAPVLRSLMDAVGDGPVRAGFGARLAQLLLDSGEPARAEAALTASAAPGLSAEMGEMRALTLARARAAQGDIAGAVAGLRVQSGAGADDLRATMLAQVGEWRGSMAALDDLAGKTIPADGPLSDSQQHLLLRQATAAAQAGDAAALLALRRQDSRLNGPRLDLFRTLTAPAVQSTSDLPRSGREIALARAIPDRAQAMARH